MLALQERHAPRLLLRRPQQADCADIERMNADPVVMATLAGVRSAEESRTLFQLHLEHWDQHGFGWWIARDRATGRFVGRGGLRRLTVDGAPEVEVGYGLVAEFWGRGLATELARESVHVAFAMLGMPDLVCFTLPTNVASQRVMQKVGFVHERDGDWKDLPHVFYRLSAERWRGLTAPSVEARP